MNVYILGVAQRNFVIPWFSEFKNAMPSLKVFYGWFYSISDLQEPSFFTLYKLKRPNSIHKAILCLKSFTFWKLMLITWKENGNLISSLRIVKSQLYSVPVDTSRLQINCYNVHYAHLRNMMQTIFLPKEKLLVSFWGSDLLRHNGSYHDKCMSLLLSRVQIISIQNEDLKKIIGQRFGHKIENKVVVTRFPFDSSRIERFKKIAFDKGIDSPDLNIMVGHNGVRENNHIKILNSLEVLKINRTVRIHLIVSYGLEESYDKQLTDLASDYPFEIIFYRDYLDGDKLFEIRSQMDLLIYAPISDAMSGTVTESLYANIPVIAGSWLPYSIYDKNKLPIHFFDEYEEIPDLVVDVTSSSNHDIPLSHSTLDKNFATQTIVEIWKSIFKNFEAN